jgi:hypothetical protein
MLRSCGLLLRQHRAQQPTRPQSNVSVRFIQLILKYSDIMRKWFCLQTHLTCHIPTDIQWTVYGQSIESEYGVDNM